MIDKKKIEKLDITSIISITSEIMGTERDIKKALSFYEIWLCSSKLSLKFGVRFNYAILLTEDGQLERAAEEYLNIIENENPRFLQAYINLGNVFERKNKVQEALDVNKRGLTFVDIDSKADVELHTMLLNNVGRLLEGALKYDEAEDYLKKSLVVNPSQPAALQHWVHLRQKQCKWPIYVPFEKVTTDSEQKSTSMLAIIAITDDPAIQLEIAKSYVAEKVRKKSEYLFGRKGYSHKKIRIGYFSSDLCTHAVGILTAEMYGLHDRSKFEIYAFCWSKEDGTEIRQRIKNGVDHLIKIGDMEDLQAARCIRNLEIDVLIDLNGLTSGTRHNILTYKPAPIQLTYLGLPATTGIDEIDYVIADEYVIKDEICKYFTEKPLYLPGCFQVNDRHRRIGESVKREKYGLPEDKFVFCSFNNTYKITEEIFAVWLRIISKTANSVLWIMADNQWAIENLRGAALNANVDPNRLFFAGRVSPTEYLARYQCADLFLDTFPFNGGTTASDSLWAGLPVLTLSGRSFASRYAGSLLRAVDLECLITNSIGEYEQLAIEIGSNPVRSLELKQHLQQIRLTCELFDTPNFVRKLELSIQNLVRDFECLVNENTEVLGSATVAAPADDVSMREIYVVLVEPDIDQLTKIAVKPTSVEIIYFDPTLEDKLLKLGFVHRRFYDVSSMAKYSELAFLSKQSALAAGDYIYSEIKGMCNIQAGFNWYYETFLYIYMYSNWYHLLGQYLAQNFTEIFRGTKPIFMFYDNPCYIYFYSFLPASSVLEVLAGAGCQFEVSSYGLGDGPANGVVDVVPDLYTRPQMEKCSLLFHLPTVMYDKSHLERYINLFDPAEVLGVNSHYWDQFIAEEQSAALVWTNSVIPVLQPRLLNNISTICERIRLSVGLLLNNVIATPVVREKQIKFFVDFARSQLIFYYTLQIYFSENLPKNILMADHDTGFHGPLAAFAKLNKIPITTFPHSKVSFHFPYATDNVRCLVHPVQGDGLMASDSLSFSIVRTSFPEVLIFDTSARRKIRTVGIVLNAMSGNGILLRQLDEYMTSLSDIIDLLRSNGVAVKLRGRPGQTLYQRIEEKTGILVQDQSNWSLGSMMDWGKDIDFCVMYDTPTSGQIEFLKQSIPIAHAVLSDCAYWERTSINSVIVPSLNLAEIVSLLKNLIDDDQSYLDFRRNQFVAYVTAHSHTRSLDEMLCS